MRAVIQRVSQANVAIDGAIVASIDNGLLVLVGVEEADNQTDIDWLAKKIVALRVFDDAAGVPNLSVADVAGGILIVSQFTLHASTKKGNRPSYIRAAPPHIATALYEQFVQAVEALLQKPVPTGRFGANMQVKLQNDGPITIIIDTKNKDF